MASHRKPRTRILESPAGRRTAVGVGSAALASATLLTQEAGATPAERSIEDVQKEVDHLYHEAERATERYNGAKERTAQQRTRVEQQLDEVAKETARLNESRRELGRLAAAQYRTGGVTPTATFMLAPDPQTYFDQAHLMERLTNREKAAVDQFQVRQAQAAKKRTEAQESLRNLTDSQEQLQESKQEVQTKLSDARKVLDRLTEAEKERLAELERKREEEARRKAEEAARQAELERQQQAEQERREQQQREQEQQEEEEQQEEPPPADPGPSKSEQVLAFAEAQLGKPYVWGATGPDSYDCSGLTQAAWREAGISLPRTTYDQVNAGTQVAKADLQPGDLVFFYDDISHVGIYVGNGQMIHASKPGDDVKYESIDYMPFHSGVRPA
ncbi:NlpC/P60 family protein [Streptomyces sp. NBC_01808]|uniref:C40 family peptidase n=1 Tax=Streptomyces sp. NBC_01808 TaxID=2975947 RepID=UPI002DD99102|nr:NlpC/P60 family protein [Streptomyces sp. NBC_01808]WSA39979.1 NlpC/P60 family protein [Streptomyces sp. NBC_01808]